MMRGLDLKKFKKVASDDDFTTLSHYAGHTIKVARNKLSKQHRSELDALPMASGGEVPEKDEGVLSAAASAVNNNLQQKQKVAKDDQTITRERLRTNPDRIGPPLPQEQLPAEKAFNEMTQGLAMGSMNPGSGAAKAVVKSGPWMQNAGKEVVENAIPKAEGLVNSAKNTIYTQGAKAAQAFAKGAKGYADGGEVRDIDYNAMPAATEPPAIDLAPAPMATPDAAPAADLPTGQSLGHDIGEGIRGGATGFFDALGTAANGVGRALAPVGSAAQGVVQGIAGQPLAPIPTMDQAAASPKPMSAPPQATAPATPTEATTPAPEAPKAGATQGDKLLSAFDKQTQEQAKILQDSQEEQKALIKDAADTYQATKDEYAHFIHDVQNQHIDPDHLWNSKSDAGRAATIIGIMLAGFSPTANPNAAVQELDKAIDRDIDAQKAELGKKNSLLSANMQHFKDLGQAIEMTRAMQAGAVSEKMKAAAAKAGDPVAKAKMLEDITKYDAAIQARVDKVAQQKALSNALAVAKKDPSKTQAVTEAVSAADPKAGEDLRERATPYGFANTKEGGKTVREAYAANEKTASGLKRLLEINAIPGKSLSPTLRAEADTIQSELKGPMRTIMGLGTLSEGDMRLLDSMLRNPTAILSLSSTNKKSLETLSSRMQQGVDSIAKVNGLTPPQVQSTPQYQTMGGVKYMKVPGGWRKAK